MLAGACDRIGSDLNCFVCLEVTLSIVAGSRRKVSSSVPEMRVEVAKKLGDVGLAPESPEVKKLILQLRCIIHLGLDVQRYKYP